MRCLFTTWKLRPFGPHILAAGGVNKPIRSSRGLSGSTSSAAAFNFTYFRLIWRSCLG